jgi:hypothetical protein
MGQRQGGRPGSVVGVREIRWAKSKEEGQVQWWECGRSDGPKAWRKVRFSSGSAGDQMGQRKEGRSGSVVGVREIRRAKGKEEGQVQWWECGRSDGPKARRTLLNQQLGMEVYTKLWLPHVNVECPYIVKLMPTLGHLQTGKPAVILTIF